MKPPTVWWLSFIIERETISIDSLYLFDFICYVLVIIELFSYLNITLFASSYSCIINSQGITNTTLNIARSNYSVLSALTGSFFDASIAGI